MSLRSPILVSVLALSLVGCASSNVDLIPVPAPSDALRASSDGAATLQVQVQNQGLEPVASSPVMIKFLLRNLTVRSAVQDGGALQPGESSAVLEFPIPKDCLDGGCDFQVCVDPEETLPGEKRSNNLAQGHCVGQAAYQYTPSYGTERPTVQ